MKFCGGDRKRSDETTSTACRSFRIHRANSLAAAAFGLSFMTASVDPPQFPDTVLPSCHCGSAWARHLPFELFVYDWRKIGPQAAEIQPAYLPFAKPWYQASVK